MREEQPHAEDEVRPPIGFAPDVLEALLDQLSEGITIVGADGTILEANRASAALLNDVTPHEMRGRFDAWADEFEVRDAEGRVLSPDEFPIARALDGERVERFEMTTRNLRTGEVRIHEVDSGPVLGPDGRVALAISRRRDVTRERHERDELERLYASELVAKRDAERANELLVRLNRLALALGRVVMPAEVAQVAARLAREVSDARGVAIVRLLSDDELETIASDGFPSEIIEAWSRFPLDAQAPLAECVRADEPVFVSSPTERRARYRGIADRPVSPVSRSWAAFPLHEAGIVSGAIGFGFPEARTFPASDQAFLSAIAEQVSAGLGRVRLLEDSDRARREAEEAARRLRRLEYVTDAAISDLVFESLLEELLERVRSALEADSSTLLLTEGNLLRVRACRGLPCGPAELEPVPVGQGAAGRIFSQGRPLVVEDVSQLSGREAWLGRTMCSLAGVPLRVRRDLVGVLHVATVEPRAFAAEDVQLLELVGARVASALERAALYGER